MRIAALRRLSIRARLTLTYTALILLTGAVMLAVVFAVLAIVPGYAFTAGPFPYGSTHDVYEITGRDDVLRLFVIVSVPALLVVGGIGGVVSWLVAGRLLRPLRDIITTADRLGAGTLDARVDVSGPPDEIRDVGATLNRMLDRLETAFVSRSRFAANASHELRTPLASVRGYAELTRRMGGDLPKDVVYAMGRIESESIRMTSMVEDLLLLARLDEGREIQFDDVDLTGLVLDAVNDAHAASPEHPIEVDMPDAPVMVVGDAPRLHQVIVNLVTNARTHTPDGTRISVGIAPSESGSGVDLTVRDTGQGIDPDFLPKLFERFARADSSRSRTAGSTGLGLAIVDAVVQAHGGSVDVRSEPGDTVFTVHLPSERPVAAVPPEVSEASEVPEVPEASPASAADPADTWSDVPNRA